MNNLDDIPNLISGRLDPQKKEEVLLEILQNPQSKEHYKKAKLAWSYMASGRPMDDYRVEKSYNDLRLKIQSGKHKINILQYWKVAAAVALVIGFAYSTFIYGRKYPMSSPMVEQYTTVSTKYGQMAQVALPDGSTVWLNAGSKLTYSNQFSVHDRNLVLEGEAYFDVKRNEHLPLVVSSGNLNVKVLGTKFNVSAYPDDSKFCVVLESGSVELGIAASSENKQMLKPGEMGQYDRESGSIQIQAINAYFHTSWRNGALLFNDTPMDEVIKRLERKFNIAIKVKNPKIYKSIFTANFQNESLPEILDFIRYTCPIKYKLMNTKDTQIPEVIFY